LAWTIGTTQDSEADAPSQPSAGRGRALLTLGGGALGLLLWALDVPFALGATLVWLGGSSLLLGLAGYRSARPPKDGPLFAIASIKEGPVEVVGRVVPPKQGLLSPLTSTKCSYFDYKIWLLDEQSGEKKLVESRDKLTDFWLKDVTGSIWVVAEGLEIDVPKQLDEDLRTYDQTPRAVGERLHKLGVDPFLQPGVRRAIFFEETRLDPGDNMLVRATARRDEQGRMVLARGSGAFSIERWTKPTFIAQVPLGARLRVYVGAALVLGGVASWLL